jgi:hypothetical protein
MNRESSEVESQQAFNHGPSSLARRWVGLAVGAVLWWGTPLVAAADTERDACGCYSDGAGNCYCDKKAKCGCPGQCEPKGCEAQRSRELEKEIETETKRAQQSQRAVDDGSQDEAEAAPRAPAPAKAASARATPPAPKLTVRQRRDLARLLELYVAGDPPRRAMSADELLSDLSSAGAGAAGKRP